MDPYNLYGDIIEESGSNQQELKTKDSFNNIRSVKQSPGSEQLRQIKELEATVVLLKKTVEEKDNKIQANLKNTAILLQNISSLYKTARKEIEERDIEILRLKRQLAQMNSQSMHGEANSGNKKPRLNNNR